MWQPTRRDFLRLTAGTVAAAAAPSLRARPPYLPEVPRGERPNQAAGIGVLLPRERVPLSFIIDDSTCLVNMGYFCMPQFAAAWPNRAAYKKPWRSWPREIPDDFVREFCDWCGENGVRGKYSVVPNPACVGWLDRELPGWSRRQLSESLALVRDRMTPNWDLHPEMITHTRVIDLRTGRPFEEVSPATMENSYPQEKKSVDELASYLAYALEILKNCDLPCEGITTPGGFGGRVQKELSLAAGDAVRDVYAAELPHYFKYVASGDESTEPLVENARGLTGDDPRAVVNVPAGTGDWFGGWDGDRENEGHRYANEDATKGRMVELIEREQPAVMLCHWPGLYNHGAKSGLRAFQRVVEALHGRYSDRTQWLKVSEIARYWAAKELTAIERPAGGGVRLRAPFACPSFTVRVSEAKEIRDVRLAHGDQVATLDEVQSRTNLAAGNWRREGDAVIACFDLVRGESSLRLSK